MQIHELPEYSGDPATNDVFPIDTGTHTFKLPFADLGEAIITTVSATISGVSQTVKAAIEALTTRVSTAESDIDTLEGKTADISFSASDNRTTIDGNAVVNGDFVAGSTGITGGGSARVYVRTQNVDSALIASNQTGRQGLWNYNTSRWVWYADQNDVLLTNNFGASARPVVLSSGTDGNRISFMAPANLNTLNVNVQDGTSGSSYTTRAVTMGGSDRRMKKNIKPAEKSGLDVIRALQVMQFDWKDNHAHWDFGIIAQDAKKINESIVIGEEKEDSYLGIDTLYLCDILIKAVQELSAKVEALENER